MRLAFPKASLSTSPEGESPANRTRRLLVANTLLLSSLLLAFVFLFAASRSNSKLREERNRLKSSLTIMSGTIAGPPSIEVGDIVPSFEAVTLNGKPASILYDGSSKYLLYIFSPRCGACLEQFPNWNRLTSLHNRENLRIIGLTIDSEDTEAHLRNMDRKFDVYLMSNKPVQRAYRVVAIPLVMLVSPQGNVEWVHYGGLSEDKLKELSSLLGSQ